MSVLAVIPARYASTRLPAKMLAAETGKPLVQHVYEQVKRCTQLDRVMIATDDDRIRDAVVSVGGEALMTRADHVCGTDRVAEVAARLGVGDDDLVLNVQGDEPEIHSDNLAALIRRMEECARAAIGTIAAPFAADAPRSGVGSPLDPNTVKVVLDDAGFALYFSRSPIPYPRRSGGEIDDPSRWLLHMGVYAFRAGTLRALTSGPLAGPHPLEQAESLEQLRWLARGMRIAVAVVALRSVGIDTPEDYRAFVARHRARSGEEREAGRPQVTGRR